MTSFTVSLTQNDWDKVLGGWRCPVLKIPGAEVNRLYANGSQLDEAWYRPEPNQQLIRWARSDSPPDSAALAVTLTKDLVATEKRDFWKTLALFVPVLAAAVSALGGYAAATSGANAKQKPPAAAASAAAPAAAGSGSAANALAQRETYERWTVVGHVKVEDSGPYAVLAMVHPPIIPLRETGRFEAQIPVLNRGNGDLEFPTLTFVPRQAGYKSASVELGDDRAEFVGTTPARGASRAESSASTAAARQDQKPADGPATGYQSPDYKLLVNFSLSRVEVRKTISVEREKAPYNPEAARKAQRVGSDSSVELK